MILKIFRLPLMSEKCGIEIVFVRDFPELLIRYGMSVKIIEQNFVTQDFYDGGAITGFK